MFIRCRPNAKKTKWTVMVCRSVRKRGKVSQEIVKYLGVANDDQQLKALKKLAKIELKNQAAQNTQTTKHRDRKDTSVNLQDVREIGRRIDGVHDVFGRMFDRMGLSSLLKPRYHSQLKDIVLCRVASPLSKRHSSKILHQDYHRELSEQTIYRLMDRIEVDKDLFKKRIFETTQELSEQVPINLLLFDVTTLHFESQRADELRDFGYSKDHKANEVQVVLALATTSEGLPIGYTLFPGKTAEVRTLLDCLRSWRKLFDIRKVLVVGDRAMMSEENLSSMEEAEIKYVVAAKLRSMSKTVQREILLRQNEKRCYLDEEALFTQELMVNARRLVVSYSPKRAAKNAADRKRILEKIKDKRSSEVTSKKLMPNRGYLKFFKETIKGQYCFDEEKLAEEEKWDGLHGLITNDETASSLELISLYRRLWAIEEAFRVNKHTLEMRPIYHFKPRRIEAHILICFLAYATAKYTQFHLKDFCGPISIDKIRQELMRVESSILQDVNTGNTFLMPSNLSQEAKSIYRAMGIRRLRKPSQLSSSPKKCSGK